MPTFVRIKDSQQNKVDNISRIVGDSSGCAQRSNLVFFRISWQKRGGRLQASMEAVSSECSRNNRSVLQAIDITV